MSKTPTILTVFQRCRRGLNPVCTDIVLWDSHPLALGATPQQVWIDGIPQLTSPQTLTKPASFQHVPKVPNFDKEAKETLKHDGLPPLEPTSSVKDTVIFANITNVFVRAENGRGVQRVHGASEEGEALWAVVRAGKLACVGSRSSDCVRGVLHGKRRQVDFIDLEGGELAPGLTTFGSALGLEEIMGEMSTKDGIAPDGLSTTLPGMAGGSGGLVRAVDGLQFSTRHAL